MPRIARETLLAPTRKAADALLCVLLIFVGVIPVGPVTIALAQDAAQLAAGEAAWDKAGCLQCHGASGEGGTGGEFPAGPSLRATKLDRAALTETISCGLPGTAMPAWLDGAYVRRPCYGFPSGPAPDEVMSIPVLSADDVQALVDFLMAKFIGK